MLTKIKQYFSKTPNLSCLFFNILKTVLLLALATILSFSYYMATAETANIPILYVCAIVLTARYTSGYIPGIAASVVGVIGVNYLFTYPFFELNFTLTGYPLTFAGMLTIALITSTTTTHMKEQTRIISERETLLLEAEKEKMRANLLRAVSHDLRTPLTSIIGASTAYLENGSRLNEDEKNALVSHIHEDSNWLLNMVENLLSVTRIQSSKANVSKSLEPVEEVVSEAVARLKKRIPGAAVTARVPDEFIMIPMDAILIEQVIINLLENAIVHADSTLPVECMVDSDESFVYFHIIDHGIGIMPELLDHLFDGGGYPSDTISDSAKGMGIGLSICKTIITAHGGTIHAYNHEDGAAFVFSLPRKDSEYEK